MNIKPIIYSIYERHFFKFMKFLSSGLPSFLLAVPLNILLVEIVKLDKTLSYSIVILIQITINFFILKKFAFDKNNSIPTLKQFLLFLGGIFFFRAIDVGVFTLMVKYFNIYYIIAQIINVLFFSIVKYLYSKKIIEGS